MSKGTQMQALTPSIRNGLRLSASSPAKNAGFTLVEVMVVVVILGVVAAIAAPTFRGVQSQSQLESSYKSLVLAIQRCRANGLNVARSNANPELGAFVLFTNGYACIAWDDVNGDNVLGDGSKIAMNLTGKLSEGAAVNEVKSVFFQEKFDESFDLNADIPLNGGPAVYLNAAGSTLQPAGLAQLANETGILMVVAPGGFLQAPNGQMMAFRIDLVQPAEIESRFADPGFHPGLFCVFPTGQTVDWTDAPGAC